MIYHIFLFTSTASFVIFITLIVMYNNLIEDLEKGKCTDKTILQFKKRANDITFIYYTSVVLLSLSIVLLIVAHFREKPLMIEYDYFLYVPIALAITTISLIYHFNKSVDLPFGNCDSEVHINLNIRHMIAGEIMLLLGLIAFYIKVNAQFNYFPFLAMTYLFGMVKLLYSTSTNQLDANGNRKLNLYSLVVSIAQMSPLLLWSIVFVFENFNLHSIPGFSGSIGFNTAAPLVPPVNR